MDRVDRWELAAGYARQARLLTAACAALLVAAVVLAWTTDTPSGLMLAAGTGAAGPVALLFASESRSRAEALRSGQPPWWRQASPRRFRAGR